MLPYISYFQCCECFTSYRNESRKYNSHSKKAEMYPDNYLALSVDGMDQSKQIFRTQNCKIIILVCLHTHVTGAILHTKAPSGNFNYCFVELVHYHHDSNLMCWSAIQNRAVAFHNCCTCWCKENKINMF